MIFTSTPRKNPRSRGKLPLLKSQKGCLGLAKPRGRRGRRPKASATGNNNKNWYNSNYTSLSRNQVVLLVYFSNMYLYPDNEPIIMRLNHVKCVHAVFDLRTVLYCIHRLIVLLFPFISPKYCCHLFFTGNFPRIWNVDSTKKICIGGLTWFIPLCAVVVAHNQIENYLQPEELGQMYPHQLLINQQSHELCPKWVLLLNHLFCSSFNFVPMELHLNFHVNIIYPDPCFKVCWIWPKTEKVDLEKFWNLMLMKASARYLAIIMKSCWHICIEMILCQLN